MISITLLHWIILWGLAFLAFYLIYAYWRNFYFFRDPVRKTPKNTKIVSPADGKIVYITEIKNNQIPISIKGNKSIELVDVFKSGIKFKKGILIGIFLSPFDIHYQRSPISGKVRDIWYHKSKVNYSMLIMWLRIKFNIRPFYKASEHIIENERNIMHVKNKEFDCFIVQIADKLVNKIDCYVKKDNKVRIGQKIGMIRFGSQVDLFIPNMKKEMLKIKEDAKTLAGITRFY
ncbi:MAG: phosphatidylserine decarboxylase [Candidatus Thorarchaeota archaeon]